MDSLGIRNTFLDFYEQRGHRRYPSASLIPNDPTLLLTSAGMVPFKPYFLGDADPPHPRAASFQKSARTTDIENVGRTSRHLTFFEMLGNFSFGDYFKREAISWAWELATGPFGLDPERIWVSVYEGDDESPELWLTETDVPAQRIQALGREDNFWWMHVAGPGGPNTELHFDRGPDHGEEGGPAVDGERYFEFYNLVFMQYRLDDEGTIQEELPKRNVDTGMGLERMAVLQQDVPSIFETDVLRPIVGRAEELTGTAYGASAETDVSLRIIAEHVRSATVLISDGVLPSKEGRGYVLRRLLRRAVRHARLLGTEAAVLPPMVDAVLATMAAGYPELEEQRELVTRVTGAEEAEFARTLRQGTTILDEAIDGARTSGEAVLGGDTAFRLHDTYGFPIDLTREIVEEAGLELDRSTFDRLMDDQRTRARAAQRREGDGVEPETYRRAAGLSGGGRFIGYDRTEASSRVVALIRPGGLAEEAGEGDEVEVVLDETPFYPEGGGQVGDSGVLETASGRLEISDTRSPIEGLIVHRGRVTAGEVAAGQGVAARVDAARRAATARSHSATHILHATVRELLGAHAQQAGSLVDAGRLRFDFPHFEQVPREQLEDVEARVVHRLLEDHAVRADEMPLDRARAEGAIALFGEKYGDLVRVVSIGDYSKELCGGTHVPSAVRVGSFVIVREESIGANLRRLEALTGEDAHRYGVRERLIADEVARLLGVAPDEVVARIEHLVEQLRRAERELARIRGASLATLGSDLAQRARPSDGLTIVAESVDDVAADELRQVALEVRGHIGERGVVVLGSRTADGKAQLVAVLTADLVTAGAEARPILQPAAEAVGGGAGGKGELAQAGGRQGDRLEEALQVAVDEARRLLSG